MEKLEWSALEYEEKERSADWFWALGVIVVTASLTSAIYGNYFFAILLVLSGILLGFFAKKAPDMISYELNDKGIKMRTHFYPYKNIKSFWVQTKQNEQIDLPERREITKSILFIKVERLFMPIISIPIEDVLPLEIRFFLLEKNVSEEEMKEHPSEKIMEFLGF